MTRRFYKGAQAETKQEAGHSGQHWADDELAIITRPDLSTKQAALMLGRTDVNTWAGELTVSYSAWLSSAV